MQPQGTDPILPAVLELPEEVEDAFLHALIPNLDSRTIVFRLSPCYSLYLMARYRASTHFRPELNPMERAQRLTLTLSRVGAMMQAIVQERYADPPSLAFWMANASELLHFLKSDRHICAFSLDGQDLLAEAVISFFFLFQSTLQQRVIILFLGPNRFPQRERVPHFGAASIDAAHAVPAG